MNIKTWIKTCIKKVLYLLPLQRSKIVFINYDFTGYGDNPKYIAEEIIRQELHCKLVWLVNGDNYVPSYINKVYLQGIRWFYELSTASIIITNRKGLFIPNYYTKKKQQFLLQTWHGDFSLKYIEKEAESSLSSEYVASSKADSEATNAIVSGNIQFKEIIKQSFWLPKECTILEYGLPRNDIYFKGDDFRDRLKKKMGFSLNDKILLYAPTFRDNMDVACYNLDFRIIREILCQIDSMSWKIIIRLHPNISSKSDMFQYDDNIINGSSYPDQQELNMISDVLITDYSSIMGDFILMKKPVFLYVPDLEKYSSLNNGRGLREMFYKLPFSLSSNQEELETCITIFDEAKYNGELGTFMKDYYCTFGDGHSSEHIVDYLKEVCEL